MSDQSEAFYHKYDLNAERKHPSKRVPASHQSEALESLRKWFESQPEPAGGILVLPTGGGKTFVAVRFLCTTFLSQGYKVLWLAHTHHLLEQAYFALGRREDTDNMGCEVGRIAEPRQSLALRVVSGVPGHSPVHRIHASDDVVIATLQTVTKAFADAQQHPLREFLKSSSGRLLVVFDEAHHSPAPSYRTFLNNLRQQNPRMWLLGLTATPTHSDEKKKGWLKKLFPQLILHRVKPEKLMADKILAQPIFEAPITTFTPEFDEAEYQRWVGSYRDLPDHVVEQMARNRDRNEFIVQRYVENHQRYGKTIMFADRWVQCEHLIDMLEKRGIRAGAVYHHEDADPGSVEARNKRSRNENANVLEAFRKNQIEVLVNVRMLAEGTDVPDIQTVFLTRQTTSRILLTQMVGRALRGPRFGGTDKAYIVSFIDDWKQAINWADYDQLAEGLADETRPEYGRRPPLQSISIELVRQLARQLDSGVNIARAPFLSLCPLGWYRVDFQALAQGSEDIETVRQLIMVFENERPGFQAFIANLLKSDLDTFAAETTDFEACRSQLEDWREQFLAGELGGRERLQDIFHLARHIAQNGEEPNFFSFAERDEHDLDKLAQHFSFDEQLDVIQLDDTLAAEYSRNDRYWKSIYHNYELFKSQYDSCVNRLLHARRHGISSPETHRVVIESRHPVVEREPSEEAKEEVKSRDGHRCLCCGETNKRMLQADHIAPSYYGGSNSLDNLQTLCRVCNQAKGINTLNFRVHQTLLTTAPKRFPVLQNPRDPRDTNHWEQALRQAINAFYQCAAVRSVRIGKRGQHFHEWTATLFTGNPVSWLEPHLEALVERINEMREEESLQTIKRILATVPDQGPAAAHELSLAPVLSDDD